MSNYRSSLNSSINDSKQQALKKHCCNVMEVLVAEEVEKQIQALPVKVSQHIKQPEVVAYALNRLPGLYATSKRGFQRQWHHAKTELSPKITMAVRQGIVAVQRDPLRVNDPLNFQEDQAASAIEALEKLKVLLQCEDLSWEQLPDAVEQKLLNLSRGKTAWNRTVASNQDTFDWNNNRH
ncbi:late competence development ComFB family protein [Anabaena sphaerica FACHB-251]|uniref:Late competence development ComFB family protein n=1 Tax=Anabaena sphaerica FACHB-251 TaxID=2692883 RepID=A0A927A090_9NOST|nr:late competence development ComFB family protein [Anabaena sphaerica]MBD2293449.1 late competence development ComFB family protein [Anabaena sphaerica FACHB-251]